jgi:sRNA-binding protein
MIPDAYLKIAKTLVPYLIGAVIAGLLVGWVQQIRVRHAKADLATAQAELKETKRDLQFCQDANKANQATITSLTQEVKDALTGCDSRLAVKDRTLKNLKRISELTPGKGGSSELKLNAASDSASGDVIIDELNRMYTPGSPSDSKN